MTYNFTLLIKYSFKYTAWFIKLKNFTFYKKFVGNKKDFNRNINIIIFLHNSNQEIS